MERIPLFFLLFLATSTSKEFLLFSNRFLFVYFYYRPDFFTYCIDLLWITTVFFQPNQRCETVTKFKFKMRTEIKLFFLRITYCVTQFQSFLSFRISLFLIFLPETFSPYNILFLTKQTFKKSQCQNILNVHSSIKDIFVNQQGSIV